MVTNFSDGDVASLLRIAGEVGELECDLKRRREHILDRLLDLIGGCLAVCCEVDPNHSNDSGWAIPNSTTCSGDMASSELREELNRYLTGDLAALDPCVPHLMRRQERVATVRREDVVDRSWYRSEHFNQLRRPRGIGESIYSKLTTPDGRRLKMTLHRELNDPPFTQRHVRLMHVFNQNLTGLYITNSHAPALAGERPWPDSRMASLPPRVRPVLQCLLAGDAEKEAARKLGLSRHTVHEYTKVLYRTFDVSSRGELLAQFVTESPIFAGA